MPPGCVTLAATSGVRSALPEPAPAALLQGHDGDVTTSTSWPWDPLVADARPWVLQDDDPGARWLLLTAVLDVPDDHPEVRDARTAMLADPGTADLVGRLAPWDSPLDVSGHHHPAYAPNLLELLADRGLRAGEHPRVDAVLATMLAHQDEDGRFTALGTDRATGTAAWSALLCDTHAITGVLVRYGFAAHPRTRAAVARIAADLTTTAQGAAWPCRPDPVTGFRGPGRIGDMCPQVTLEALRTVARLPATDQPPGMVEPARTALAAWVNRGTAKPYMFGHGRSFKAGKWPATWYSALEVVDVLGRWPQLWRGPDAAPADRRALAEVVACLVAATMDDAGRVVPRSTFRGFEQHSFGRKRAPSAFATARTLAALHRVEDLAADVAAVDVAALPGSKGSPSGPGGQHGLTPPAAPRRA